MGVYHNIVVRVDTTQSHRGDKYYPSQTNIHSRVCKMGTNLHNEIRQCNGYATWQVKYYLEKKCALQVKSLKEWGFSIILNNKPTVFFDKKWKKIYSNFFIKIF